MTSFMNQDFLLSTPTARELYHQAAENMPIIDYHCHLDPKEIAQDRPFTTISEAWLGGDHYKWRVMRAAGVPEELVTGNAPDREKFLALARVMPKLMGNPIYHWCHLELQRTFGIQDVLNEDTADSIYTRANRALARLSPRKMMEKFGVRAICTTDDPADDLRWHRMIKQDPGFHIKVLPAFRPDKAVNIEKQGFSDYIRRLGDAVGKNLQSAQDVADALLQRVDFFSENGCLCADHGLDACMYAEPDPSAANSAFGAAMAGAKPDRAQADAYKTLLTIACARRYRELGWVMQIHFGCLRNINGPLLRAKGPDMGGDAINSCSGVENLAPLLNAFAESGGVPKMILYSLNPGDSAALASIMGCFQGESAGRLQLGSAWWFNDSRPGMRAQLTDLACGGVLGQFVGMLTDSRSFLSYPRHEYFRRVLCELVGEWVESGQYPYQREKLFGLIKDLCFRNTNSFFGFMADEN